MHASLGNVLTKLVTRKTGKVAYLTVSRPSKLNALNTHLLEQLPQTIQSVTRENADLLAVVLSGAGPKAFIGGADIAEMAQIDSSASARSFISKVHAACTSVRDCPVPVIARVNGYALGAGLELAASCDFRVASREALFGMPEVRVGIPSVVEAALLPGLIGWGRTRLLLLLGQNISAEEALRWGLVERVMDDMSLDGCVEEWLGQLEQNGPLAVRRQKALMRQWEKLSLDEGIDAGITAFGNAFMSERGEAIEPTRKMGEFLRNQKQTKGKL